MGNTELNTIRSDRGSDHIDDGSGILVFRMVIIHLHLLSLKFHLVQSLLKLIQIVVLQLETDEGHSGLSSMQ